jgi:hypothetical protein
MVAMHHFATSTNLILLPQELCRILWKTIVNFHIIFEYIKIML